MAFATLLSLFVVPAIYLGFARIGDRARSGLRQPAALEGAAGG